MKKYIKGSFVVIFACFILIAGYFSYQHFFWGRVVTISDATKAQNIVLTSDSSSVFSVRLHVTGSIDGEAALSWSCHTAADCSYEERISPGVVDVQLGQDWYEKEMIVKYQPSSSVHGGKIKIRYSL